MENIQQTNNVVRPATLTDERLRVIEKTLKSRSFIGGISLGLMSAFVYSLAPLLSFITISVEKNFGDVTSSTMYVVWQEVFAALVMMFFYKPQNFIRYFKHLKDPRVWLVVLVGVISGPIAMVIITLSNQFTIVIINGVEGKDGSIPGMILNLYPLMACLMSNTIYKTKNSKYGYIAFAVSSALILGLTIHFSIVNNLTTKGILGLLFGFGGAILYALEAVVMYGIINKMNLNMTNKEAVSIKTGCSALFMLIFAMPIASLIDGNNALEGYKAYSLIADWAVAIKYIGAGVLMGCGRTMYYYCIKTTNGSYTASTQLLMLFWTPIIQYVMMGLQNGLDLQGVSDSHVTINNGNPISEQEWWYWLYTIFIVIALLVIVFDENFFQIAEENGWRAAIFYFKYQGTMSELENEKYNELIEQHRQEQLNKIAQLAPDKKKKYEVKINAKLTKQKHEEERLRVNNDASIERNKELAAKHAEIFSNLPKEKQDKILLQNQRQQEMEFNKHWKKVIKLNSIIDRKQAKIK